MRTGFVQPAAIVAVEILRQKQHKRLTRAILFYMYWNCDIGEVANAET